MKLENRLKYDEVIVKIKWRVFRHSVYIGPRCTETIFGAAIRDRKCHLIYSLFNSICSIHTHTHTHTHTHAPTHTHTHTHTHIYGAKFNMTVVCKLLLLLLLIVITTVII